jgi:hypothetical protein
MLTVPRINANVVPPSPGVFLIWRGEKIYV